MSQPHRYFLLNKPADMVSQFVSPDPVRLLSNLPYAFPEGTHAVGRLDNHSEGLLILTTNKKVTRLLFQGEQKHKRTYLVLVKNVVTAETLHTLRSGIQIKIKSGTSYTSSPCDVQIIKDPTAVYSYAIDEREAFPHTWLQITLTEGKFHQVRKMVFNAGHRCMRLIRVSIESLSLNVLKPGEVCEVSEDYFFRMLSIRYEVPQDMKP